MIKMEGRLLNLEKTDTMKRKFAKGCEITFPNKVPAYLIFNDNDPTSVIGNAEIIRDDEGLACKVNLININENLIKEEYYVGGYYTSVKKHDDKGLTVIDAATLRSMSIVSAPSDKSLIIRKCKEEQL